MKDNNNLQNLITISVIDDSRTVTEGITTQINWQVHGISVCGTAMNGQEGWELIQACRPDIVLTDIRMPKLDGIMMTRKVKESYPNTKVLIITGYNDFEYAQQALKLGAFDLITKPFSLTQIEEAVLKAKQKLEKERELQWQQRTILHKFKKSLPVRQQEFFQLLIRHKWSKQHILERLAHLEVDLVPEKLAVMVIEVDHYAEVSKSMLIRDIELMRFAFHNILEETLQESVKGTVYLESSCRFVAIFNVNDSATALSIAERCRENIHKYTRYTVSIGLSGEAANIEDLPASYEQAITALAYHFYTGGNGVVDYSHKRRFVGSALPSYSNTEEQELALAIRSGNEGKALAIVGSYFARLGNHAPPINPEHLVSLCYELGYLILRTLQGKLTSDQIEPLGRQLRNIRAVSITFAELQVQLMEICSASCKLINNLNQTETMKAMEHSLQYIRNNLHQELTITQCAKQAYLSPSYYSNVFKQATGMTFIQFLTQERMERAKTMLLEDQQIQDISEYLGYANRRYFSDLFKKHTGLTPSEFRHNYQSKA